MEDKEEKNVTSKWLILVVIIIGSFMSTLDSSIVNIAIPKLMSVFGVSLDDVKWVLTAYTLTLGAVVPVTGYLGDTLGTKKLFLFALITFTMGSFLCGMAWSNTAMIAFRIIQALGGGMIIPVGMTMMMKIFSKDEIGTAVGLWGIAALAAPAIGPTLGGYIIEKMDWRLIFYINVPIGIIAVAMAIFLLPGAKKKPFKEFDYIGFITSTVGLVSTLYVIGELADIDWTDVTNPILLTLGIFSLLLFIVNELSHKDPILELRVLNNFQFSISQVIQCILFFALMGGMYVMPLFLENVKGYTAMQTGLILLPSAIGTAIIMPISGKLFDKIGAKIPGIIGLIILVVSSYELAFINQNTSEFFIEVIMTIRGIGFGLSNMPVTTAGMNAVTDPKLAGKASALNNTIKQIAGSLGVTIMTLMIQGRSDYNYVRLSEQVTSFNPAASDTIGKMGGMYVMQVGLEQSTSTGAAVSAITQMVSGQARIDAMDYALAGTTVAAIIALGLIFFISGKKREKVESVALQE